jgi:MFS family permease
VEPVEAVVEETRPASTGPRAALRLIGSRNFGPYFVGNALSASGTWFQNLAASLLVFRLTHSVLLLGVLNFVQFAPVLLLAPWSGSAADRFDRRRVLMLTQVGTTVTSAALAVLAWSGHASAWAVIGLGAATGVTNAFASPASLALIGSLVSPRDLPSGVALNSMTYNLARAVGPALAAVCVRTLGIPTSFAINAVSCLPMIAALLIMQPRAQVYAARGTSRLRDSLRLLRGRPELVGFLLVVAAVGFASDPVNTESPAFAHAFGRPDTDAGYLIGAFGAGAVTAAFLVAGRVAGSRRRLAITLAMAGGGIVGFALSPWLWLGFAFLFVAGFGYLSSNTSATSRLQLDVEEHERGRIMALWSIAFLGMRPFASLLDGAVGNLAGVRTAGVVLAVPALLGALIVFRRARRSATTSNRFQANS